MRIINIQGVTLYASFVRPAWYSIEPTVRMAGAYKGSIYNVNIRLFFPMGISCQSVHNGIRFMRMLA